MKKNDLILLLGIILLSAIMIVCLFILSNDASADIVTVTVDGEAIAEFPINEDVEYLIVDDNGGENLLIIKDGCAYIKEANCPDKVCVRTGNVQELKPITCLPNKVVVSISER